MNFSKLTWQKHLNGAPLTHMQYRVLSTIATYTGKTGQNAFPGLTNLARDCGIKDRRAIRRTLRELERDEWIVVTSPGGNEYGKGRATVYALGWGSTEAWTRLADEGSGKSAKGGGQRSQGGSLTHSKGDMSTPPSDHASGHTHHSEGEPSASTHVDAAREDPWGEPERPDYRAMMDDYDVLCEWLHAQVGYEITEEPLLCNTALGMWENEQHPVAILNKLKKEDGI